MEESDAEDEVEMLHFLLDGALGNLHEQEAEEEEKGPADELLEGLEAVVDAVDALDEAVEAEAAHPLRLLLGPEL